MQFDEKITKIRAVHNMQQRIGYDGDEKSEDIAHETEQDIVGM